jgi:sporulation protein YlmC with PRC-barrel domain
MLLSVNNLSNYKIEASDGSIGQVDCFLFDDQSWAIRYVVVDVGTWLTGRKVLLAPSVLDMPETLLHVFSVKLTRQQVKDSPDIDADLPVSRQQEIELYKYYGWANYWEASTGLIGIPNAPIVPGYGQRPSQGKDNKRKKQEEPRSHLRSTKEVTGYKIHATDGQIGHVEDFIVDTDKWRIQYLVVDTREWLADKKIIIPPDWITRISWANSEVVVDVTREKIENSPEFDPTAPVNRQYEIRLYDYYGRPKYWP